MKITFKILWHEYEEEEEEKIKFVGIAENATECKDEAANHQTNRTVPNSVAMQMETELKINHVSLESPIRKGVCVSSLVCL